MQTNPERYGRQPINKRQIKMIHAIKGKLGMGDGEYRTLLQGMFGVFSCKELSWAEAEDLVSELNRKTGSSFAKASAFAKATADKSADGPTKKYADLDGRPGMATGAQCRMIAGMWADVSRMPDAESRDKALRQFLYRIVGISDMRWLKNWQVEKLVKALEAMGAAAPGRDSGRR
ncbi:MAG: regulatory protein GemA [Geobacteraceae bacterium]|nr:regulatory protein GemA [Geobacteraceae bacterium]